jgi:hypothetical protein
MVLLRVLSVVLPVVAAGLISTASVLPAYAQDPDQADPDTSSIRERLEDVVKGIGGDDGETERETEKLAFRPLLGGLQSGAGIVVGVRFIPLRTDDFLSAIDLRGSLREYWGINSQLGYELGRFLVYGFARYRHMPQEDFYGIGPDVDEDGRSDYRLDDVIAGLQLGYSPLENLLAGVHASYLANYFGRGTDDDEPNIEDLYDPIVAPGLGADTKYGLFGAWLEYDTRDLDYSIEFGSRFAPTRRRIRRISYMATRGLYATADVRRYNQVDGDGFSFTEGEVELQQYVPFSGGDHVVAFREYGIFTSTDGGDEVPLYLLPTLGGTRTLRGYRTFMFRDQNALLANVEYRWNGWRYVQPAVFVDAGNVFRGFDDFNLEDTKLDVGASLRLVLREHVVFRVEGAYGEDGFRKYVRVGMSR